MAKLTIKYRLEGKALPPRPIRVSVPGWGGSAEKKKETGSDPQPWHCSLHVEGSTHGLELLYPFDTSCQLVNDDGQVKIVWDPSGTPGDGVDPRAFTTSTPRPSINYLLNTMMDLQPPPGYVLRTEPHPRYFADITGTAPAAVYGHVQSHWWPKQLFVVFKIPFVGQRHVFRTGDPYAQVLFIPEDQYEPAPMELQEAATRRKLEREIGLTKSLIAKNVWTGTNGVDFSDHYRVLARINEREGTEAVHAAVADAMARFRSLVPQGRSVEEYLDSANRHFAEGRAIEATELLQHVMRVAPNHPEAYYRLAMHRRDQGLLKAAAQAMGVAVSLGSRHAPYYVGLGDIQRELGLREEARASYEMAARLAPGAAAAGLAALEAPSVSTESPAASGEN